MAGAGFYAIGASQIVFGRDGKWYADGEPISNQKISLLFSRHLVPRADGSYQIVMGDEKATVEVEDTPWVVTRVDGDPSRGFVLTLNDETEEPLDPGSLAIEADDSFSCCVKKGSTRARFLRPAHNSFAHYVETVQPGGEFVVEIQGQRYDLARRPGADHR